MFFLRTVRLSLTWLEVFTQKQHVSFKMAQVHPCSGIRRSISYFVVQCFPSCVASLKLSWESLSPETIWGVFIRMTLICSPEWCEIFQELTSVLFYFLSWLDSWLVNPGVIPWYFDCCGGRKYYRVGDLPCGLELSLWGPIFPDFN